MSVPLHVRVFKLQLNLEDVNFGQYINPSDNSTLDDYLEQEQKDGWAFLSREDLPNTNWSLLRVVTERF